MVKNYKTYLMLIILISLNGCACALTLKAAIGVGAWDALAQTFSLVTSIKVGTMGFIFNCGCVLGELLLLKKEFNYRHILQILVSFLFGFVVNFMSYSVLNFELSSYPLRLIALIIEYIGMAIFVGGIMALNVVTFALEGFCLELSKKTKFEFSKIRQSVDIIGIIVSLLVCFFSDLPLVIREGTVLGMLIYAPILKIAMDKQIQLFKQLEIINER